MDTPASLTVYGPHVFFSGSVEERKIRLPASRTPDPVLPSVAAAGSSGKLMNTLFREAGLDVSRYRAAALARRQAACLRALGTHCPDRALRIIAEKPHRVSAGIDAVLLGVTGFFRDPDVFSVMEQQVLPRILKMTDRPRIWSAACSSGQELYSVALLLEQACALDRCELLGTDCREEALRLAACGAFEARLGCPLQNERLPQWSAPVLIPENVRRNIRWLCRDLFTAAEAGPWDLILWRNMAIYLTPEAAAAVWEQLYEELRPGGYLIAGKAECPPRHTPLERIAPAVYRKPSAEKDGP
jgi:chemotaxis protein methyltransferase CheR